MPVLVAVPAPSSMRVRVGSGSGRLVRAARAMISSAWAVKMLRSVRVR